MVIDMPTPRKTALQLQYEKTAHKSKQYIAARQQGEAALLTGVPLKASEAVRDNPRALKEFKRLQGLLSNIDKDDELYGNIINRYCLLAAECDELVEIHKKIWERMESVDDTDEYTQLAKIVQKNDALLQQKRKMMFDIEKENIMTIASALRSIPRKQDQAENPILKALASGG